MSDITTDAMLIRRARRGDEAAWEALVRRYAPLVDAVARAHRLPREDAEDVGRMVWLRLTEHLDGIRDPSDLPAWIAAAARHESRRVTTGSPSDQAALDAGLRRAERSQALRNGLAELPAAQRRTLLLFAADPPLSNREISDALGVPIAAVGPMRDGCLERLRATPAMRRYADAPRFRPMAARR
jgi:RNA polymerase sigma factor (sigma-70 family)